MSRYFTPTGENISYGDITAARFLYNQNWTFVCFTYMLSLPTTSTIVSKYTSTAAKQQFRFFARGVNTFRARHNQDTDSVEFGSGITTSTWYMAAVTCNTSSNMVGYAFTMTGLNGTNSATLSGNTSDLTEPVLLGNMGHDSGQFDGYLAHAAYFSETLSQVQLEAYRSNPFRFVAQYRSSTVFYSPLGLGSPEPDYSGNRNNGTVTGTSVFNAPPVGILPRYRQTPITMLGGYMPLLQKNNLGRSLYNGLIL